MLPNQNGVNDQTQAGCDAIAQAVAQTGDVVKAYQISTQEALSNTKAALAESATLDQNNGHPSQLEQAITAAVNGEIQMLHSMAESVKKAHSTADEAMAAAMRVVQATAGEAPPPQQGGTHLEQATLAAVQGMTNN